MRLRPVLSLIATLGLLASCEHFASNDTNAPDKPRRSYNRSAAPAKPVASETAKKTCTETFKLTPGDARYDKCISSLSELETKP